MRSKLLIAVALVSWLGGCAGDPAETGEEPTDTREVACDGADNDGDGLIDEGLGDAPFAMYPDADGDGYGLSEEGVEHTCLLRLTHNKTTAADRRIKRRWRLSVNDVGY